MSRVAVIGAGAWGTTLSILLAEKGHQVVLWVYENDLAAGMAEFRENKRFLPGFQIPETVEITGRREAAGKAEICFFAVPTQFLRAVAGKFVKNIDRSAVVVSAGKGIEEKTLKLPLEILA